MEQENQPQEHLPNLHVEIIGVNKYNHLKSLKSDVLTDEQKKQIELFESKSTQATPEQIQANFDYFDKIKQPKKEIEFSISAKELYKAFKSNFETVTGKEFKIIEDVTIKNLEPIIYYFSKDERFFECENLSKLSVPSFEKGLLIIGTYGNGKTSTLRVFEHIFKMVKPITFKGYTANDVVNMFEKCDSDIDRDEFEARMWRGKRFFDDVKTEKMASNYGKINLFKEIIEERYSRKLITHITCNFKEGFEGDLEAAVDEFGEKYGSRVYDRIFEMFNIIEFKGKSFRK